MKFLIINGSLHGNLKNSGKVINYIINTNPNDKFDILDLSKESLKKQINKIKKADSFIVISGTYVDNYSSYLQKFFENFIDYEGTSFFIGKPAVSIILSHSTGGRDVLNRVLINLNFLGCQIPPFGGIELSFIAQEALKTMNHIELKKDIWQPKDIDILITNCKKSHTAKFDDPVINDGNYKKIWTDI